MHAPILETPVLLSRLQAWPDEAACQAAAARLAGHPGIRQACIELEGPLGAGKTTFARHLLRALGVQGRIKSPSYAIVEPYDVQGLQAWHFDFYRFDNPREWEDAGLRDLFAAPGLKLVEWPQRARGLLPVPDIRILIEPDAAAPLPPAAAPASDDDTPGGLPRLVTWQAFTPHGQDLLR